jgi:hypothetical protein
VTKTGLKLIFCPLWFVVLVSTKMDVAPLQPPAAPPPVKKTTNLMKKQRDSIVHRAQQSFKLGTPPGGFWQAGDQIQGAPHDFPAIVEARAHIAHREPLNIDSRTLTLTIK